MATATHKIRLHGNIVGPGFAPIEAEVLINLPGIPRVGDAVKVLAVDQGPSSVGHVEAVIWAPGSDEVDVFLGHIHSLRKTELESMRALGWTFSRKHEVLPYTEEDVREGQRLMDEARRAGERTAGSGS